MEPGELERLRADVEALQARVTQLERQLSTGQPQASASIPEVRREGAVRPELSFTPPARPSLESRIGSQLFNRVGIVALLVGVAWFLKYAADQQWLGAGARVIIGLAVGLGLIGWSERFRRRQYPVFSFSLKAVGTGVLYLAMWASFALFHLVPYPVAFAGMMLVTAGNAWMCWVQRSEVLAAYAAIGGFLTPALLAQPETSVLTLGAYLAMLNAGLLALLVARRWPRLLPAAFIGTGCYFIDFAVHAERLRGEGQAGIAFWLAAGFFALFAVAPAVLAGMEAPSAGAVAVGITLANAAVGGFELWQLADHGLWLSQWLLLGLAGCFSVLLLVYRGRPGVRAKLGSPWTALVLLFTACGFWTGLSGAGLVAGWALEAACVLALALRPGADEGGGLMALMPEAPAILMALATVTLLVDSAGRELPAASYPIVNVRFALYLLLIAVAVLAVRVAARQHALHSPGARPRQWSGMGAGAAILAVFLLLVAGVLEIHIGLGGGPGQGVAEQFWDSAWGTMLGAALLVLGFRLRWALLRWQALALLTLAIAKVFLVDTRSLSQGFRIMSFLGLGVFLLGVSFIYQRDLLNLRGKEHGG